MSSFTPPLGLRNPHIQTIFSSIGPRRTLANQRFARFRGAEQKVILNCGEGVRLSGVFNQAGEQAAEQMVILIHGWEGNYASSYMLSMATTLLNNGVDVFRLNLRDHGDSHHLNYEVFNSTMVPEVIGAIEDIQRRFDYPDYSLGGFSLGGNFACRVAATAHGRDVSLSRVVAFCPAIHAGESNVVLNARENWVYGQYFVRKWKASLYKKLEYFPDYGYRDELGAMTSLDEMNEKLIPKYTGFSNVDDYFAAYRITDEVLADTICPLYLHFAKDDMIIPYQDIERIAKAEHINITLTEHGGHCGYIKNWKFENWQDQRLLELLGERA